MKRLSPEAIARCRAKLKQLRAAREAKPLVKLQHGPYDDAYFRFVEYLDRC